MSCSEKMIAFTAIFVSCLALTVSIIQTRIIQKQSHAAVWPRLTNGQSYGPKRFNYEVENEGVGPAIVKSIHYSYQDTSISNFYEFLTYIVKVETDSTQRRFNSDIELSTIMEGDVIAVGETVEVFSTSDSSGVYLGRKYLLNTDITIEYCSIYDHCWRMENNATVDL